MPKYFCDYCDTHLTHDSPSVRKTHNTGRKHKEAVKLYYMNWLEQEAQHMMTHPGGFPPRPGFMIPGMMPPGMVPPMGMPPPPPGMLPPPGMMPPPGPPPPGMHPPPGGPPPPMPPHGLPPQQRPPPKT